MTTDQTATVDKTTDEATQLVDLEVFTVIYEAANTRLGLVREAERRATGVAKTDLTDVGRAALHNWRPSPLQPTGRREALVKVEPLGHPAGSGGYRAVCSLCADRFPAEGAAETRSEARHAAKGHSSTHTTTFRFSMTRDTYRDIKAAIRGHGLSVASVVQDGLEMFARTGKF